MNLGQDHLRFVFSFATNQHDQASSSTLCYATPLPRAVTVSRGGRNPPRCRMMKVDKNGQISLFTFGHLFVWVFSVCPKLWHFQIHLFQLSWTFYCSIKPLQYENMNLKCNMTSMYTKLTLCTQKNIIHMYNSWNVHVKNHKIVFLVKSHSPVLCIISIANLYKK